MAAGSPAAIARSLGQPAKDGKQFDIIHDPDAMCAAKGLDFRFVEVFIEGADHIGASTQGSLDDALIVWIGYDVRGGDRIGHLGGCFEPGKRLPDKGRRVVGPALYPRLFQYPPGFVKNVPRENQAELEIVRQNANNGACRTRQRIYCPHEHIGINENAHQTLPGTVANFVTQFVDKGFQLGGWD